ncbi:MAG: cytochrome c [Marinilabiliales bacterium]|nr:cytochrome c [Marinilabiliales bacterium]
MKKFLFAAFTIATAFILFSFVAADKKPAWNIPAKYTAMKISKKGDKESIALGKTLYVKHCKSCHGGGKGDGAKAASLKTEMDDLTTAAFKALPDGNKYYMAFVGRGDMPNFEKKITDEEERWAIINYLNSL